MRHRAQRANLFVICLRRGPGRVHLRAMFPWGDTMNVRSLRSAECRKEQRTKKHETAMPGGEHGQGRLRVGWLPQMKGASSILDEANV